jgi:hypothetical protein
MEMKQMILSSYLLTRLEIAFGISKKVAMGVMRDSKSRKLQEYRQSIHGQRQAKNHLIDSYSTLPWVTCEVVSGVEGIPC